MLKQSSFFDKIKKKKLTFRQYEILYKLYSKPKLSELGKTQIRALVPSIYINMGSCTLSSKGEALIKSVEMLFKPIKKLSNIEVSNIDDYKINGDFIESQAFAYLAIRSLLKLPITFKETTGVKKPVSGGVIYN